MVESDSIRLGKTGRIVIFQPSVGGARSGKMLDCYGLNTQTVCGMSSFKILVKVGAGRKDSLTGIVILKSC